MTAGWSCNVDHGRESHGMEGNIVVWTPYIHPVDIS
jgi:hypothetical protein